MRGVPSKQSANLAEPLRVKVVENVFSLLLMVVRSALDDVFTIIEEDFTPYGTKGKSSTIPCGVRENSFHEEQQVKVGKEGVGNLMGMSLSTPRHIREFSTKKNPMYLNIFWSQNTSSDDTFIQQRKSFIISTGFVMITDQKTLSS